MRAGPRQQRRGHPGGVPALLRGGTRRADRPEPAVRQGTRPQGLPAASRLGDHGVRRGVPEGRGDIGDAQPA